MSTAKIVAKLVEAGHADLAEQLVVVIGAGGPPKALLNKAVKAMQIHLGAINYVAVKNQQRFYDKVMKVVNDIASKTGMDSEDVWKQVETEARKKGIKRPQPGKDL